MPFVLRDDFASAFIKNDDETAFVNDAKTENFDEIAEYINSENTSRKKKIVLLERTSMRIMTRRFQRR